MKSELRTSRPEDAAEIAALLIRSIREICGPDYGNDASLIDRWCANKTPQFVETMIASPRHSTLVAEVNGVIAGFAAMTTSGELLLCYLLPEFLHQGIGSELLGALRNEARALGLNRITLESTLTARGFYQRHGFVIEEEVVCFGSVPGYRMNHELSLQSPMQGS